MKKSEAIIDLAEEVMIDITNSRIPLHNILLKASRLSLLLDMPQNVNIFKEWAKYAEQNIFVIESFKVNIESAKDPNVSLSSSNEYEHVSWGVKTNFLERKAIRDHAQAIINQLAKFRTETYNFALGIYTKGKFGKVSETIFEKKRTKSEPILREIFPDINQRLNSIEQNIKSNNPEDWKNAVVSCRTLLMDISDVLNPPKTPEDKGKYINRLKDFISPLIKSNTKKKLLKSFLEEMKNRMEYTLDLTQGGAHKDRPTIEQVEDAVLYTYLLVADLMIIYKENKDRAK